MTPLSVVFRVDATDDVDARRQLVEVIATATRIMHALAAPDEPKAGYPFLPDYPPGGVFDRDITGGRPGDASVVVTGRPLAAEPITTHVHRTPDGKTVQRPWAPGQDGMGE